jgi:DNA-binding response OmpR family regulator
MTAAQFEIIRLLIEAQGAVVTVAALGRHLYERALTTDAERIRAHILRIRRRLAQVSPDAGRLVRTVRAVGYRLEPSAEQTSTSSAGRGHAGPSTAGRTHK